MNIPKRHCILAAVLTLSAWAPRSLWANSKFLNVQGMLTNSSGNPLTGNQTVTFRLYTSSTVSVSSAVWTESDSVTLSSGIFNLTLGSTTALDPLSFSQLYYLGIQVAGDSNELSPRQVLGASAYAQGSLGNFNVGNNLVVGSSVATSMSVFNGQAVVVGTMTVQGNAFSVGGSLLAVSAGSTTVSGDFVATSSTGIWMSGATYVKATQSADTTLPGGNGTYIYTKINFNTVTTDVLGEFNTAQASFTAKTAGYYQIVATCYLYNSVVGGNQYHIALYKNNVSTDELAFVTPNSSGINISVNDVPFLNTGDGIQIFVSNAASSSASCYAPLSYLTIRKMP